MVKLGGRRIHLGEIRSQAQAISGVVRAAIGMVTHERRTAIALVIVSEAATVCNPSHIRSMLADVLPNYMLPGVIRVTDAARLTANGKSDERGLIELVQADLSRHGFSDGPLVEE